MALLSAAGIVWLYADDIRGFVSGTLPVSNATLKEPLLAIVILCVLLFSAIAIFNHARSALILSLIEDGANIRISDSPPRQETNGLYYVPFTLSNTGKLPALDYYSFFGNAKVSRLLNENEEDAVFAKTVGDQLRDQIKYIKQHWSRMHRYESSANELAQQSSSVVINPNMPLTPKEMAEINNAQLFLYNFAIMRYTDSVAKEEGIYYYASVCAYYSEIVQSSLRCTRHNFEKRVDSE